METDVVCFSNLKPHECFKVADSTLPEKESFIYMKVDSRAACRVEGVQKGGAELLLSAEPIPIDEKRGVTRVGSEELSGMLLKQILKL